MPSPSKPTDPAMNIDDGIPFWIKVDICGRGAEWQLAFIDRYDPEDPVVRFPIHNFEERWDPKRFSQCPQWKIAKPGSNESEVELLRANLRMACEIRNLLAENELLKGFLNGRPAQHQQEAV
jgi:hypothetical protein